MKRSRRFGGVSLSVVQYPGHFLPQMSQYTIEITDHLPVPLVDHDFLRSVIQKVLDEEQVEQATISVALVDDAEIHRVNCQFLGHDYPTDVISFLLNAPLETSGMRSNSERVAAENEWEDSDASDSEVSLDGEIVVSTETAIREADSHGWSPAAELLLYVVHGLLHLCGYDDVTDEARPTMRSRERELLAIWGFCPTGLES